MRLIDADELMDVILRSKKINSECALEENAVDTYDNGQQETFELVIKMVEDQPTAYDPDKVVKEINEWTFNANIDVGDGTVMNHNLIVRDTAIEIVKGGGVDE